ncbi:unnamed protein product [Menidia menidia]|uniref:(Atlantic silverside) hypothetical protein n=1 Tax=Menidia menidia TaxID=238744 RepID=A0A8S4AW67_9TELE|nr:unnamed protein product [Menidia menidia]
MGLRYRKSNKRKAGGRFRGRLGSATGDQTSSGGLGKICGQEQADSKNQKTSWNVEQGTELESCDQSNRRSRTELQMSSWLNRERQRAAVYSNTITTLEPEGRPLYQEHFEPVNSQRDKFTFTRNDWSHAEETENNLQTKTPVHPRRHLQGSGDKCQGGTVCLKKKRGSSYSGNRRAFWSNSGFHTAEENTNLQTYRPTQTHKLESAEPQAGFHSVGTFLEPEECQKPVAPSFTDTGSPTGRSNPNARRSEPVQMFLHTLLLVLTDLAAGLLGTSLFRRHFHLLLSAALLLGPALSLWVSPHSVFAKRSHFLYRLFLGSGWGWTSLFAGSFLFSFSFSVRRSLSLSLRHLSRLGVSGGLWLGFCRLLDLLENSTGSCYEPLQEAPGGPGLLVLREGQTRGGCRGGGLVWRGYEVSEDVFLLCLCCLLLVEETAVLGPFLSGGGAGGRAPEGPFPAQLLGGALGCLSWRGLYRGWFRMGPSWFCPGRPGQGLLHAKAGEPLNHNHN